MPGSDVVRDAGWKTGPDSVRGIRGRMSRGEVGIIPGFFRRQTSEGYEGMVDMRPRKSAAAVR